jgi:hypothetical protein
MSKTPPDPPDSAADLRRRLAAALHPDQSVPKVPIIGRGNLAALTRESFTSHIAQALGLPRLHQESPETDAQYLIRRLNQIKFVSRYWSLTRLESLTQDLFNLAAMQICDAAANYAQDRNYERAQKEAQR